MIIERGVSSRSRFELVVKIEDDFIQRQIVSEHNPVGRYILEPLLNAPLLFKKFENRPEVFVARHDGCANYRLFNRRDTSGVRQLCGIVDLYKLACSSQYSIAHGRGGSDEFERELSFKTLLNDLHMEKAEKTASKTEPQSQR